MKTFCEVCTANPATLFCCADDAVMCGSCDQRYARGTETRQIERRVKRHFLSREHARAFENGAAGDDARRKRLAAKCACAMHFLNARFVTDI
jgi:hypothetical protein